jgi:hypothetical protein
MDAFSKELVLNLLNRSQDQGAIGTIEAAEHLALKQPPLADCQCYDWLLKEGIHAAQ